MLVSVIIPTYNRARTIERAVNSVLGQSWEPIEIIVVDDGSTDRTADILTGYSDKIRLIRQKNQGPSAARNAGIKAAKGEIISFLDSDDSWLPEKMERQVRLLQATESAGVKCCVCNATMEFATGTVTSFATAELRPELREGVWTNPAEILVTRFLLFNQVVAVRREALDQAGYFRQDLPYGLNDDYDLALRLSLMGPWAFIADPLAVWYEHADNISRTLRQLDICLYSFQILKDLSSSSQWGPLLPKTLLRRRMRALKWEILAQHLSNRPRRADAFLGRCALGCLRVLKHVEFGLRFYPRMLTEQV
jgi:glycosyltransferase involved in cell wall biosynthesis